MTSVLQTFIAQKSQLLVLKMKYQKRVTVLTILMIANVREVEVDQLGLKHIQTTV